MLRRFMRIGLAALMCMSAAVTFVGCADTDDDNDDEDRAESSMPPGHDVMYKCAKCGKSKSHPSNAAQGPSC